MKLMILLLALNAFPDRPFETPTPDVTDVGLSSSRDDLTALATQVQGREDAECFPSGYLVRACFVEGRTGVYQFTEEGHDAHPAAFYRGYETNDSGRRQLAERGWFAGDPQAGDAFFSRGKDSMVQPAKTRTTDPAD